MTSVLRFLMRAGLVALGVATGATTVSTAGPIAPLAQPQAAEMNPGVTLVQDNGQTWRRNRNRNAWNNNGEWNDTRVGERRDWRDGRRGWRDGRRHWNRHHHRDYPRYRRGPVVYFDFEAPVRRYVEPRRAYRAYGLSADHVQWCRDRYRTYRAWDNSFQPNRGPRRECYSPYT
jgi:hypothetical protein